MRPIQRLFAAMAVAVTFGLITACGGGGGQGSSTAPSGIAPFSTSSQDLLPAGARIDVSALNLFPMGAADEWSYYKRTQTGTPPAEPSVSRRVTLGPDGNGNVTLTETQGGSSLAINYVVSSQGLLLRAPLDGIVPPTAAGLIGSILQYALPLYPQGTQRLHIRSGAWGKDLDGDGLGESFRYEYSQTFVGFETAQLGIQTLQNVARFQSTHRLTIRHTAGGVRDYELIAGEEAWFAPSIGMIRAQRMTTDSNGATLEQSTLDLATARVAGVIWTTAPHSGNTWRIVPLGDSNTWNLAYDTPKYSTMVDALAAIGKSSEVLEYFNPNEPVMVPAITTPTIGRVGWDTVTMAPEVPGWITKTSPDIVTLNIGINDQESVGDDTAQNAVVSRIAGIVDSIITAQPGVAVFVSNFERKNDALPSMKLKIQNMVQSKFVAGKRVYFVASYVGVTPDMFPNDNLHPDVSGRAIIMQNWINAIKDYVTGKLPWPN